MKFIVELDDFWMGDDDELERKLKSYIISSVYTQISNSIKNNVEEQISKKILDITNRKLNHIIDTKLSECLARQTIVVNHKEITIEENVRNIFQNNANWNYPTATLEAIAKNFVAELKLQYNNMFANRIVQNMKEQGLLKDEVVQILLSDK